MPTLYFGNGIYSSTLTTVHDNQTVVVPDSISLMAFRQQGAAYVCTTAVQRVPLTDIILDFGARLQPFDEPRLSSVIVAFLQSKDLAPLSVEHGSGGKYKLLNGYHRFIASVLFGFIDVPIDLAALAITTEVVKPWVPKFRLAGQGGPD